MKRMMQAAGIMLALLNSGCAQAKAEIQEDTDEEYGKVLEIQGNSAVLSVQDANGEVATIKLNDDEKVAVVKDNTLISPSSLDPDDAIIVTYKNHALQVVQVISK